METANLKKLSTTVMNLPKILIVDDEPANLQVLGHILGKDYKIYFAKDGQKAIEIAKDQHPNLILLDIMMPGMSGYDVVKMLKNDSGTANIPVIFVTAMSDVENEALGFECKAVDYITKPVIPAIVHARVRTHLSLVRVDELNDSRMEIIRRLGHAAEFKDNETGLHVIRMSHYSKILAEGIGLTSDECDQMLTAAPMHDVGKIGIPDSILLKPGKLDDNEWKIMKKHPYIGYKIIGDHDSPLLNLASSIAYTHHEKWNGEGYPRRLKGEEIPLEGRIVAVADVFDALTTARPYKEAWPVDKAVDFIREQAGHHFDPELSEVFVENLAKILDIRNQWMETDADTVETVEP